MILISLALMPAIQAAADFVVTAVSCSPDEVKINSPFSCTVTVQNNGDATGTLNTATLYPDSSNWLEDANYAETVAVSVNSGASTTVVFDGLQGTKAGNNGFARIMLDSVTDTFVADNGIDVNVIDVIVVVTSTSNSAASSASVDVTGQATMGGNTDVVLSFTVNSGGCSIGSQASSSTTLLLPLLNQQI